MKIVEMDEKVIYGISIRTTNSNEMNPETAKIGKTWQKFDNEVIVDYQNGERVYGVYYNYESDLNGEFSVLAGYEKSNSALEAVTLQKSKYIVFEAKAKSNDDDARIQAVIATWGEIWQYFNDINSEFKRAYKTDYEHYKHQTEIDIYISID
jgi:predicted transcriptional regulator YdeE